VFNDLAEMFFTTDKQKAIIFDDVKFPFWEPFDNYNYIDTIYSVYRQNNRSPKINGYSQVLIIFIDFS